MARILVVEDNEMIRDMLVQRLRRRGHEVITARDGAAGVAVAVAERPALVMMDMSLPVIDGWEATRRLRARPEGATVPIIGITAHAIAGDRERCLAAGCDDYFAKPFDFEALLASIARLLRDEKPG